MFMNTTSPRFYLLSGEEAESWTGDQLEHLAVAHPGDYLLIR